jgi:ABC-2 type transport system permease protein
MQVLLALIRKEFKQIFRNPNIVRMMLMAPVVQLIIIPLAADFEVKNVNLAIMDHDQSPYSHQIADRMTASGYFRLVAAPHHDAAANVLLDEGKADLVMEIPAGFERQLVREQEAHIAINADAVNTVKAGLGLNYAGQILQSVNQEIRLDFVQLPRMSPIPTIAVSNRFWYNPEFNYRQYMAPGILALLLIMVGAMMSALNIVREREIGTMEQINVTPVKSYQFLLAKLIPFLLIGLMSLTIGLGVCLGVFGLWAEGSYFTIYAFAVVFLIAALGIGQLIAIFTETQQQATLFAFFFMMMFVLLSGLYTPLESMPQWAQVLAYANPVTHFVDVMRSVMLKGSNWFDLQHRFWALCGFAILFNTMAILLYRKRS